MYYVAYHKGTNTVAVESTSYDNIIAWWCDNGHPALAIYDQDGKQYRLGQW